MNEWLCKYDFGLKLSLTGKLPFLLPKKKFEILVQASQHNTKHTLTYTNKHLLYTRIPMASSSIVLFQKEIYKFQNEYIKEIIDKLETKELMTPELTEFFNAEIEQLDSSVKDEIKKAKKQFKKTQKKDPSEKKEKTPRQILLSKNMSYVRDKYKGTGVVQTNVMTCAQYMTTKMMNDSDLDKYDALLEAIKEVNEKRGETIFEKVEKDETTDAETTDAETNAETKNSNSSDVEVPSLEEEDKTPTKPKKTKKVVTKK